MRKNKNHTPRPVFAAAAGDFFRENVGERRTAQLLKRLNSREWRARNLATGASIKILDKNLHPGGYHDGWSKITAMEALGKDWGKVEVGEEAEEIFGVFTQ